MRHEQRGNIPDILHGAVQVREEPDGQGSRRSVLNLWRL